MKNKARFWKITILSVILISFASLITYKVIAGSLGASSPCPPSATCPSVTDCPPEAEVQKECSIKDASDKEASELLSGDESKKTCLYKGQGEKKAGWVHPKK